MKRLKLIDRDALRRCIAIVRQENAARAEQIDDFLREREWDDVGEFCSYCVQMKNLCLRPWEMPPSSVDTDDEGPAGDLLRRLVNAGLSKYEPDPVAALAEKAAAAQTV
jgi:hypothetical protein